MSDLLKLTADDVQRLRRLNVASVYLFGSYATGTASPRSDYDLGVLVHPERAIPERLDATYRELYALFADRLPRAATNRIIDIVFLQRAPLELRFHVVRYGRALFDDDPPARARFEEQTTTAYCDYRPLLDLFDRAILGAV